MRKLAAILLSLSLLLASAFDLSAAVALNWNASTDVGSSGVGGYNIYRDGVKIGTSATTTYTDTTAAPDTQYTYTVSAFDRSGNESGQSTAFVIRTLAGIPFVPLHTYYISPTGSETNDGLTPATAWKYPNHSIVCGDVILVAPGNYVAFGGQWGVVSNCPSTSGGIDGNGGIYFAIVLCAGQHMEDCKFTGDASTYENFRVNQSNWSIQGIWGTNTGGQTNNQAGCFSSTSEGSVTLHHVAFINNICITGAFGFITYSYKNPFAPGGFDYVAVVGAVVYDAATAGDLCSSNISFIPSNYDTVPGTHIYVAGAFSYKAVNPPLCLGSQSTDGEGIIFDTWSAAPYTNQAVVEQSVMWLNGSNAFQAFPQAGATLANDGIPACPNACDASKIYFFQNTTWSNTQDINHGQGTGSASPAAEVYVHGTYNSFSDIPGGLVSITNNIIVGTANNGNANWLIEVDCASTTVNNCGALGGGSVNISGNYIYNTTNPSGGSQFDLVYWWCNKNTFPNGIQCIWDGSDFIDITTTPWPFGTDTRGNPGLTNPAALPTTAVSCAGYRNTTDCMNVGHSVAANIVPTAPGAIGKGYQVPAPCRPSAFYPTWLKGIVYLKASGFVSGATITQEFGLITKPCGL